MKQIFRLMIFFAVFVMAADAAVENHPPLHTLIEPPMPLSQELPITLSQDNKQALTNPAMLNAEAEHNINFLKSKNFPLLSLISALVVVLAILFIRLMPSHVKEEGVDPHLKEKNELEIKETLRELFSSTPQDASDRKNIILQIDFLLRRYLENNYDIPAFSCTAEELDAKIETLPDLPPTTKQEMKKAFEIGDKIKFANYQPSQNDFQEIRTCSKSKVQSNFGFF